MLTDDLNNSGTVVNYGTYTANVASNGGTITNNNLWYGSANNTGGTITNTWVWHGSANNTGGTIDNRGEWYGSANNTVGTITNYYLWYGSANNTGGTIDNRVEWSGDITNASGTVSNEGTIVGTVTNSGAFTTTGEIDGSLVNTRSGSVSNEGTIVGTVTNSGAFTTIGEIDGSLVNTSSGSVFASGYVYIGGIQNSGQFTLTGNLYSDQPFLNYGVVRTTTTQPSVALATPSFNNNGVLDLTNRNTVATNSVIQGNYVGGIGSVIDLNVSGTGGNTGQASKLTITGKASGASFISVIPFNGALAVFLNPIPIIVTGPGGNASFTLAPGPPSLFNYSLQQDSPTPSDPTIYLAPPTLNIAAIGSIAQRPSVLRSNR